MTTTKLELTKDEVFDLMIALEREIDDAKHPSLKAFQTQMAKIRAKLMIAENERLYKTGGV